MNNKDRALLEKNRKKQSLKSMYFNRYLLVRYVTALYFFTNLYWLISLVLSNSMLSIIPGVLILFLLASVAEQVKIYSSPTNNARYTKYCFTALLATNVICILPACFSTSFAQLYPFLVNEDKSRILVITVLFFGFLLAAFMLRRLDKIRHNDDKHYARIKSYEEVIN